MAIRNHHESESLGGKLQRRREELGLSIEEVAREICAGPRYLSALEQDDYRIFPAKVYALGFFKKLLLALALEDQDGCLREFHREWEVRTYHEKSQTKALPVQNGRMPLFTPRRFGIIASVIAGVLIAGFLGFRLFYFLRPPVLLIQEPADQMQINVPFVSLKGMTEKESHLTVNGREITIGEDGRFSETFDLVAGVHALEFVVTDRFGKSTKEIRYVLVK